VAEVDTTLSGTASLVYSTFLGGNGEEYGYGAALDCAGNAYVTGRTSATTFITTTGGVQPGAGGGGNDAFVAKIGATRVITYAYDGVQRLTDAVECPGSTYHDGYDLASNRTLETVDGTPTQQVSYDAANQVITDTTPGGTAAYSYDGAGNLLSDGGSSYRYDALDRLTALAGGGATASYGYNGDGTLVTQTVNGTPTAYTQDLAADQSQVLQTTTGTGTPTVTDYLYGLDRLAAVPSGGTARTWYMPDLQGSVRYTTDDGANASPTVNYDPYGTPEGGATPPTFGYNGELQDGATGLQNLRARTYNPATGQFLTRDPLEQQTDDAYLYAGGDPINGSDPSGQCYVVDRSGHQIGALPDVAPDDKNCAPSTVVSYALQPGHGPVYYPTTADVNCLYAQILRHVKGAGPLLRKGFYVSPAQHVPSILRDFTGGLGFLVRQATGLVGVGENALAIGEEVAGPARVIISAPQVVAAAVLATALYIVTDPATPAGGDYPPVDTSRDRDRKNRPIFREFEAQLPNIAHIDFDAIVYGLKSSALHKLSDLNETKKKRRASGCLLLPNDTGRYRNNTNTSRAGAPYAGQYLSACEEYPFASSYEGGVGAITGPVPGKENNAQGGYLKAFYNRHPDLVDSGPFGEEGAYVVQVILNNGAATSIDL